MKILAFTGMPCSGKSVAVKIAKDKNIPVIRMGDAVWEETKRQGLELTDKNVGFVANDMRKKQGKDIWAKKTVEMIKKLQKADFVVIDGIRNSEEIGYFYNALGTSFIVIAIRASEETRKQRMFSRKRVDDMASAQAFRQRDKRELGWGLARVIAEADIEIYNEGTIDEFIDTIKEVFTVFEKR